MFRGSLRQKEASPRQKRIRQRVSCEKTRLSLFENKKKGNNTKEKRRKEVENYVDTKNGRSVEKLVG